MPPRTSSFRLATLRSWLGYAGLGFLVWFLARQGLLGYSQSADVGQHNPQPEATIKLPRSEISGIVPGSKPGVYWVHNDSGDKPRIFAVNEQGQVLCGPEGITVQGAENRDWEDITRIDHTLYVADTGNDLNLRRDQKVYAFPEPEVGASSVQVSEVLPVPFPGRESAWYRWDMDCEAIFPYRGELYFLSKERQPFQSDAPKGSTTAYWLDTEHHQVVAVDHYPDLEGWVTSAAVSPDGHTLAVLCHKPIQSVWLFELPKEGRKVLSGPARRIVFARTGQVEALCYKDADTLLVVNEAGDMFEFDVGPSPEPSFRSSGSFAVRTRSTPGSPEVKSESLPSPTR